MASSMCMCEDYLTNAQFKYVTSDILMVRGCSATGASIPVRLQVLDEWYVLWSYVIIPSRLGRSIKHGLQTYFVSLGEDYTVCISARMDWGQHMDHGGDLRGRRCSGKCSVPGNLSVDLDDEHSTEDILLLRVYVKTSIRRKDVVKIHRPPNTIDQTIKMLLDSELPLRLARLRLKYNVHQMSRWPLTLGYADNPFFTKFHQESVPKICTLCDIKGHEASACQWFACQGGRALLSIPALIAEEMPPREALMSGQQVARNRSQRVWMRHMTKMRKGS